MQCNGEAVCGGDKNCCVCWWSMLQTSAISTARVLSWSRFWSQTVCVRLTLVYTFHQHVFKWLEYLSSLTYIELRISVSFRDHRECYILYQHSFNRHPLCRSWMLVKVFRQHTCLSPTYIYPTSTSLINIRTNISEKDKWVSYQIFLKILHLEIFDSIIVLSKGFSCTLNFDANDPK